MTIPVSSAARANGTMTYQPVNSIAIQAARSVCASWLVTAETPSARYATTAPIQPTENVRCAASANLRTPGGMVMAVSRLLHRLRWRCVATRATRCTGRHVAAGTVLTAAGDHHDDDQQDQDEDDDPRRLHPARHAGIPGCAGGRSAVGSHAGVVAGVGVGGWVNHVRVLRRGWSSRFSRRYQFTETVCRYQTIMSRQ